MSNPWSAFYWRDYIGSTGHLTLDQHGAYLLLMAHYYMTGRPLPENASALHRICRCTTDADRRAVDEVLHEFFISDGDAHRHRRIDQELAKAADISVKRRSAANAKHKKIHFAIAGAGAPQMHTQSQPQPQPELQPQIPPSLLESSELLSQANGKKSDFVQADFDARDLRKMQKAQERFETQCSASIGAMLPAWMKDEREVFQWICSQAGITVSRGLELENLQKQWPKDVPTQRNSDS